MIQLISRKKNNLNMSSGWLFHFLLCTFILSIGSYWIVPLSPIRRNRNIELRERITQNKLFKVFIILLMLWNWRNFFSFLLLSSCAVLEIANNRILQIIRTHGSFNIFFSFTAICFCFLFSKILATIFSAFSH